MRVLKFGGTSVATESRRQRVASIVETALNDGPIVVVTSALGGITDQLVAALNGAIEGEATLLRTRRIAKLRQSHLDDLPTLEEATVEEAARLKIIQQLDTYLEELAQHLDGIALLGDCPHTTRHRLLALGERLAVPLVTSALRQRGLDATSVDGSKLLLSDDAHLPVGEETVVDMAASRTKVRSWIEDLPSGCVPVVTGFIAADRNGRTTTLGRGASDLTATLLGAFLDVERVEIWTDVDGVLSASPHWVDTPRRLPQLSYAEAAEMARFGARVLHPQTLEPLLPTAIPVCIRNTLEPQDVGTCIGPSSAAMPPSGSVRAITARNGNVMLRLTGGGLTFYRELYAALEALEIEPLMLMHGSGGSSVSLVIPEGLAESSIRSLRRRLRIAQLPLDLERRDAVSVVAAIGDGSDPTYLTGRMLAILRHAQIESLALALPCLSGRTSEHAVAVLVDDRDVPRAVRRLHSELVDRDLVGGDLEGRDSAETGGVPQKVPLRRAQIRHEPLTRLL